VIPHGCELMIASHNQVRSPPQAERLMPLTLASWPHCKSAQDCAAAFLFLQVTTGCQRAARVLDPRLTPRSLYAAAVRLSRAAAPPQQRQRGAGVGGARGGAAGGGRHGPGRTRRLLWPAAGHGRPAVLRAGPQRLPGAPPALRICPGCSGCGALRQAVCSRCWTCLCVCTRT